MTGRCPCMASMQSAYSLACCCPFSGLRWSSWPPPLPGVCVVAPEDIISVARSLPVRHSVTLYSRSRVPSEASRHGAVHVDEGPPGLRLGIIVGVGPAVPAARTSASRALSACSSPSRRSRSWRCFRRGCSVLPAFARVLPVFFPCNDGRRRGEGTRESCQETSPERTSGRRSGPASSRGVKLLHRLEAPLIPSRDGRRGPPGCPASGSPGFLENRLGHQVLKEGSWSRAPRLFVVGRERDGSWR